MNTLKRAALVAMPLAMVINTGAVSADTWDVTVTNLTNGSVFTPLFMSATTHDDGKFFDLGTAASSAIELMAECGAPTELVALVAADTNTPTPTANTTPGASTSNTIITTSVDKKHLTVLAMVVPSNDAFLGLNAEHIPAYDATAGANNTHTYYVNAYDAGTEGNDEIVHPAGGCDVSDGRYVAGPTTDTGGSGVVDTSTTPPTLDNNTTVHVHRGILGDADNAGGKSDLTNTVHRWQNPVAKVVVVVTP